MLYSGRQREISLREKKKKTGGKCAVKYCGEAFNSQSDFSRKQGFLHGMLILQFSFVFDRSHGLLIPGNIRQHWNSSVYDAPRPYSILTFCRSSRPPLLVFRLLVDCTMSILSYLQPSPSCGPQEPRFVSRLRLKETEPQSRRGNQDRKSVV